MTVNNAINKTLYTRDDGVRVRRVAPADRRAIQSIMRGTPEFAEGDFETCMECLEAYYDGVPNYVFLCAVGKDDILGFICYDKVPLAKDVFELYWIVVAQKARRIGIARMLHDLFVTEAKHSGARMIFTETESNKYHEKARLFYESCGYKEAARVKDFYDLGNDKIIYSKSL